MMAVTGFVLKIHVHVKIVVYPRIHRLFNRMILAIIGLNRLCYGCVIFRLCFPLLLNIIAVQLHPHGLVLILVVFNALSFFLVLLAQWLRSGNINLFDSVVLCVLPLPLRDTLPIFSGVVCFSLWQRSPIYPLLLSFCMCLFPIPNTDINGVAYKHGVHEFDCGSCPECLHKRASVWALRSVYESKAHKYNCMITLTYDNFVRDSKGNIIGETPVNPNLKVNQRDVQLFFKRLRKWYSKVCPCEKIKYLCSSEYGSRTHRAHYHCLLFGVRFPDSAYYKKSKRGNPIYMSKTLTELWSHGICTIDSINVRSSIARYCTKYCCKQRSDQTFMLTSQNIGVDELMRDFNGLSYFIDGVEYPIPRSVWQRFISTQYKNEYPFEFSYKYVNKTINTLIDGSYERSRQLREMYRFMRDSNPWYIRYLEYWQRKGKHFESVKPDVVSRIRLLDDSKYHNYKVAALNVYFRKKEIGNFECAPGSNNGLSREISSVVERYKYLGLKIDYKKWFACRLGSRLITASDTVKKKFIDYFSQRC